jgi:hypothetical protein
MSTAAAVEKAITERAMLVTLSIAYWTAKVGDESVVTELTNKHKTERSAHEYKKVLIDPAPLNVLKAIRSRARAYHFNITRPWIDGGTRVLPSAFYMEYAAKIQEFRNEYETACADFFKNYPKYKGEARKRLGDLFDEADYPTAEALRRKFAFDMRVLPIPAAGDWRVDLGAKGNAEMRKQIEATLLQAAEVVTMDNWQRLHAVVSHLAERVKTSDAVLRDSLVINIKEICAVMDKMNITGDKALAAMTKTVEKELCSIDVAAMRDDPALKAEAGDAADAILAKMAAYIGA